MTTADADLFVVRLMIRDKCGRVRLSRHSDRTVSPALPHFIPAVQGPPGVETEVQMPRRHTQTHTVPEERRVEAGLQAYMMNLGMIENGTDDDEG